MRTLKYIEETNVKEVFIKELYCHKHGLMQTATGYGKKLATQYMLKLNDSAKTYRVYCHIFSNSGTLYIVKNGIDYIVRDYVISDNVA